MIPNPVIQHPSNRTPRRFSNRLRPAVFGLAAVLVLIWQAPAPAAPDEADLAAFRESIPAAAERYIGTPYAFGADPFHHGAADNSHLLCAIYQDAAETAGLSFPGYMPMEMLLSRTVRVDPDAIQPGDLMVLKDGHAAMIYRMAGAGHFDLIYASLKRGEVISFNSRNLVYEIYWLVHLDGFYRLKPALLSPSG